MKKYHYSLIFLMIMSLSCNSNNQPSDKEKEFNNLYINCEVNTSISLSFQNININNRINVDVDIKNLSIYEFVFSYTENVKMWRFNNLEWQIVGTDPRYVFSNAGADEIYVDAHDFRTVAINPFVDVGETIRIAITGNFIINGVRDEKCFGAFADYVIVP